MPHTHLPRIKARNSEARALMRTLESLDLQSSLELGKFGVSTEYCLGVKIGSVTAPEAQDRLLRLTRTLTERHGETAISVGTAYPGPSSDITLVFTDARAQVHLEWDAGNKGQTGGDEVWIRLTRIDRDDIVQELSDLHDSIESENTEWRGDLDRLCGLLTPD